MVIKDYVGHPLQTRGVEQYTLQNGKGNGMQFAFIRNGLGLEMWISVDRCADVSRVNVNGQNIAFFSPCGYVAPSYYDNVGAGFLKSFTAGFITTCGFGNVGQPNCDQGDDLPLHGTIANIPSELRSIEETEDGITVKFTVRDAVIFGYKYELIRTYFVSYKENKFTMEDNIQNIGDTEAPFMLLYHCNFGYPLLTENSELKVPYDKMWARTEEAHINIDTALQMEVPQTAYVERCYFFDMAEKDGVCKSGIYNKDIDLGFVMKFKKNELPCFTEWKMMGKSDYVLGLEPGNIHPCGRANAREDGILQFLQPDEKYKTSLEFNFVTDKSFFDKEF